MNITWRLRRRPDGFEGTIFIHLNPGVVEGGGHVAAVAQGPTKAKAIGKAAIVAKKITETMEAHPEIAALLPPGAGLALAGVAAVAKSGAAGRAMEAVEHLGGNPSLRKLASFL